MRALGDDWPNWPAGITLYDHLLGDFIAKQPHGRLVDVDSGHDIQWEQPASVIEETMLVLDAIN